MTKRHALHFRITFILSKGPLGPLGFEGAQYRQTLRPFSSRDPQQSPASFRIAVKDLEDPAVQCRLARSEWLKGDPKVGHVR